MSENTSIPPVNFLRNKYKQTQITEQDVLIIFVSRILFSLRTDHTSRVAALKILLVQTILWASAVLQ